jgi:hypothetical protein
LFALPDVFRVPLLLGTRHHQEGLNVANEFLSCCRIKWQPL